MRRKTLFGFFSLAIIVIMLVSPVAVFAQDLVPTETPVDVPAEAPGEVIPPENETTEPVVTDEVPVEPAVSLADITEAIVDTAVAVSSSDPYGTLGTAMTGCSDGAGGIATAPVGASFHFLIPGGSPAPGFCSYDTASNTLTAYFMDPIQQAVIWAQAGTDIFVETDSTFNENVVVGYNPITLTTVCGPDSCPRGLIGNTSTAAPVLNGFLIINNVNTFTLSGFTINSYLDITDSNNIDVDSVTINLDSDTTALSIGTSSEVDVTDTIVNKAGIENGIGIYDSTDVQLGYDTVNLDGTGTGPFAGWGIDAFQAENLTIYNSEIHADNGALGGINVENSLGEIMIGGDGTNMGGYASGEGLLVELSNPADESTGISVDAVTGSVVVGNGTEVDISFDSLYDTDPYQTTGISVSDVEGSAMVGVNSSVNITGGDGTGIVVNNVTAPEIVPFSSPSTSSPIPNVPGIAAVGENLEVNLLSSEGASTFGGNGVGIDVEGVETMVVLGSLQDFMTFIGYPDPLGWGGDHRTVINVEGAEGPNTGLSVAPSGFTFASGIDTDVPDGTGAIFGGGLFIVPFVVDGSDGSFLYLANSSFNNSAFSGLSVIGYGDVMADGLEVAENGMGAGDPFGSYAPGATFSEISGDLSIMNSDFLYNSGPGLVAFAEGDIDLKNVESAYNGGEGIYIGRASIATVNVLNSYIHDNVDDGIHFETWYDETWTAIPYNANIYNSRIMNNNISGEAEGIDYFGQGTLTICGGTISGNGTDIYVPQPGILVRYSYYPCGCGKDTTPGKPGPSPIVINVEYDPQASSSGAGDADPERGLVFNLISKGENGDETLLAQAALPADAVPGGSHGVFTSLLEGDMPAALPDGVSFLGPAFSLSFTLTDGSTLTALDGSMQVKFKIPDGLLSATEEPTSHVNIYFFDGSTWTKLPVIIANGYAYAQADHPGIFVLALGPTS